MDLLIFEIAALGLLLSIARPNALIPALLIVASLVVNHVAWVDYEQSTKWSGLREWCYTLAVKDFAFLVILGFRKNTAEFILLLCFAVSCLFHQAILAQVLTYESDNLTLFSIRPVVMKYVSVCQLATVFYILLGGGFNGGKRQRAKFRILNRKPIAYSNVHSKTYKAT